jgi:hypothetical protein
LLCMIGPPQRDSTCRTPEWSTLKRDELARHDWKESGSEENQSYRWLIFFPQNSPIWLSELFCQKADRRRYAAS